MAKHVALVNAAIQYTERQELLALGYFLTQQKEYIGDLPKKDDPTIKLLYSIAKESALEDANQGADPNAALIVKYENMKKIFERTSRR